MGFPGWNQCTQTHWNIVCRVRSRGSQCALAFSFPAEGPRCAGDSLECTLPASSGCRFIGRTQGKVFANFPFAQWALSSHLQLTFIFSTLAFKALTIPSELHIRDCSTFPPQWGWGAWSAESPVHRRAWSRAPCKHRRYRGSLLAGYGQVLRRSSVHSGQTEETEITNTIECWEQLHPKWGSKVRASIRPWNLIYSPRESRPRSIFDGKFGSI